MVRSMTAFARVDTGSGKDGWFVEIRSLNHRYFDFSLKIPAYLYSLEDRIRGMVQEKMRRGKVTLTVGHTGQNDKLETLALDEHAVRCYVVALSELKRKFKLEGDITLKDLLALPKVFSVERNWKEPDKYWKTLEGILKRTLGMAVKAKEKEGQTLEADIFDRLNAIETAVKTIEKSAAGNAERYFKKLSERAEQLVGEKALDRDRLHLEVAFLAERSDITEELVRLKSHLDLFRTRLKETHEMGRELEFLCQEINREVNTLSSKSQYFEISTKVILIKRELEKIREQIQNIE